MEILHRTVPAKIIFHESVKYTSIIHIVRKK